jgi:hypothetical protein
LGPHLKNPVSNGEPAGICYSRYQKRREALGGNRRTMGMMMITMMSMRAREARNLVEFPEKGESNPQGSIGVNLRGVIVAVFSFDCRTLIACYNIVNLASKCELKCGSLQRAKPTTKLRNTQQ